MMCELTFADLGTLNGSFFVQQSIINALANNHDGIGYMQEGRVWKSKGSGARILNLGTLAKESITSAPLAFHTRFATNKLLNEDCHSHPFSGEKLILMHNGKLEMKDYTVIPKEKVDSQVFTEHLEAAIVESPDIPMVDLMQTVMDKWCGKFAFMIYDTRDSEYYIIRGTTSDLYWTTLNDKLIINTQKLDLDKGTHVLRQLNQVLYDEDLEIGEIKELEDDTVYKFNPENSELEKIGEVKENKAPLVASQAWVNNRNYNLMGATRDIRGRGQEPIYLKLKRWLDHHGMSLTDLNELSNMIMGCSLLELNEDDLRCLYIDVLKVLADHVHSESLKWWGEINKQGYSSWAYYQKDFDFPWMLNDTLVIADMSDVVDAEVEQRKKERESKGTKASS
jgi:predicted glutamine amidotransferase